MEYSGLLYNDIHLFLDHVHNSSLKNLAIFYFLITLIMLSIAGFCFVRHRYQQYKSLKNSEKSTRVLAKVVDKDISVSTTTNGNGINYVSYSFMDQNGARIESYSSVDPQFYDRIKEHETVEIVYLNNNPQIASIIEFSNDDIFLYKAVSMMSVLPGICVVMALIAFYKEVMLIN